MNENEKPGEILMKTLDRRGFTAQQFRQFLTTAINTKPIVTYYRPQCKVAVLIGNDKYKHLSKLITPSIDCDSLASNLKSLGFLIVTLKNLSTKDLKTNLLNIFELIPEDSYCKFYNIFKILFIGHGPALCSSQIVDSVLYFITSHVIDKLKKGR